MNKPELQQQMDKNKFFIIKYALLIYLVIFILLTLLLGFLVIDKESLLKMIFRYYIH